MAQMKRVGRGVRVALLLIVSVIVVGSDVKAGHGQCPEVPPYQLLPANWPCPAIPTCGTQYGVCRLPYFASAGQPCHCYGGNGVWISGVCIRGSSGR